MKCINRINLSLIIVIFSVIAISCSNDKNAQNQVRQQPPMPVSAVIAEPTLIDNRIVTTGTILPYEEIEIRPEISGRVIELLFDEGSRISKGQLLVSLNDKELKANLEKINVQIDLAMQDEQRKRQLLERKAISQEEYDKSDFALKTLKADKLYIESQIEKTKIYAPFSGSIGLRYISEGANISTNTIIAYLLQLDKVKIEFSVPERYASLIKQGTRITFSASSSDELFDAEVYAVEGKIDASTRTFKLRAKCDNPNRIHIPGSFVKIDLIIETIKDAIVLPSSSVVNELAGHKVYIARDGKANGHVVELGIRTETSVQVISGVKPGDTILTSGLMQVRNNSDIIVKLTDKSE